MTSPTPDIITVPRAGMLATVRNRRGVVAAVEPFDGETRRLHLYPPGTCREPAPGRLPPSVFVGARPGVLPSGSGEFRDAEHLIVFTEYKTTLDYLTRRLRERYSAERVLTLFGTV